MGATYELVRHDRRPRFQEDYTRQVQEAIARRYSGYDWVSAALQNRLGGRI